LEGAEEDIGRGTQSNILEVDDAPVVLFKRLNPCPWD
jgi:hypothetical protein